jgi:hypothetical protein
MEKWKQITYAKLYEVSDCGNIRRIGTTKNLKGSKTGTRGGVQRYMCHGIIDNNGRRTFNMTHRIVAMHFLPNPLNLPQVNHIDEDKKNNSLSNLEWVSNKENSRHSNKRKIKQLDMQGNLIKIWGSLYEIGDSGFNKPQVSMCLNKRFNSGYLVTHHKNFKWEYL